MRYLHYNGYTVDISKNKTHKYPSASSNNDSDLSMLTSDSIFNDLVDGLDFQNLSKTFLGYTVSVDTLVANFVEVERVFFTRLLHTDIKTNMSQNYNLFLNRIFVLGSQNGYFQYVYYILPV